MILRLLAFVTFAVLECVSFGAELEREQISNLLKQHAGSPLVLKGDDGIVTKEKFQPPIQVTIIAKTDSTNLRIGYAANEVIFNWERGLAQLRIDGGPANGQHKQGAGAIPTKKYVTIRWVVTKGKQSIYVDDELRFEHEGDYSKINNPISVSSHKSDVTIKSIKTLKLTE